MELGPSWGDGEGPLIVHENHTLPENAGEVLDALSLRPRPTDASDREIEIHHEVDGSIQAFGKRLWLLLGEQHRPSRRLIGDTKASVTSLKYRDRYLFSPLSVALLLRLLAGLRECVDESRWQIPVVNVMTLERRDAKVPAGIEDILRVPLSLPTRGAKDTKVSKPSGRPYLTSRAIHCDRRLGQPRCGARNMATAESTFTTFDAFAVRHAKGKRTFEITRRTFASRTPIRTYWESVEEAIGARARVRMTSASGGSAESSSVRKRTPRISARRVREWWAWQTSGRRN